MVRKFFKYTTLFLSLIALFVSCKTDKPIKKANYGEKTLELIGLVEKNPNIKFLLIASINQAKKINPDKNSNPAQTLEEYYDFIAHAEKAMPWDVPPASKYSELYAKFDQGL